MTEVLEIVSLISGIIFMIEQIRQGKWLWYIELVTAGSALIVAVSSHIWGNAIINLYYCVMAVVGLIQWKRFDTGTAKGETHLVKMTGRIGAISAAIFITGGAIIWFAFQKTSDPYPFWDSLSLILGIIACWWLTRSHLSNWYLWIVSDIIMTCIYGAQGMVWMAILYGLYAVSAIPGLIYWKKHGIYLD